MRMSVEASNCAGSIVSCASPLLSLRARNALHVEHALVMCVDYLRIADDIAYKPNRSELVEISEDSDQNDPNDPLVQNLRLSGFRHV